MARSVVVPEAGQALVRVVNFSDKVLTLRSNLPVAEYHTSVSGSATPTEIGRSPSAPNHPYCSVIARNIEDDKQESKIENRRAKVIQLSSDGLSEEHERQFSILIDQYEGIFVINNRDLG